MTTTWTSWGRFWGNPFGVRKGAATGVVVNLDAFHVNFGSQAPTVTAGATITLSALSVNFATQSVGTTGGATISPAALQLNFGSQSVSVTGGAVTTLPALHLNFDTGELQLASYATDLTNPAVYPGAYVAETRDKAYPQTPASYNLYRHYTKQYKFPTIFILNDGTVTLNQPFPISRIRTYVYGAHHNRLTSQDVADLTTAGYTGIGVGGDYN